MTQVSWSIPCRTCYGPSAVRAVHLVVKRIPVVVGKVRAVDVVDDAVAW